MIWEGNEEGGVAKRLMLAVDLNDSCVGSELEYGCREDIETGSACMRDAFV